MKLPWFIENPDPQIYASENYLVLDFETTNLDKGAALNKNNTVVCSSYATATGEVQVDFGNEFNQSRLIAAVSKADFLVMHNAKFDLQWLSRCGVDLRNVLIWDTMIGEYVRLGNRQGKLNLQAVAARYKVGKKDPLGKFFIGAGVCPSQMPRSLLRKYSAQDTLVTRDVFEHQLAELDGLNLWAVQFTRCLLTPVLADIEFNGMCLDPSRVMEAYQEEATKVQELTRELDGITGGINFRSAKQRAEFLFGKLGFDIPTDHRGNPILTGKGQPKTNAETLAMLKARTPEQEAFLSAYKKVSKAGAALSKNLDFFKGVVEEQQGVFYAQFNQTVTQTHRLSSSGLSRLFTQFDKAKSVQFQNLPRRFKRLFKARNPGWKLGEVDGAQLEFRVAAFLGNDPVAKAAILNDEDIHADTAAIFQIGRQDAKPQTFQPLYGGRGKTDKQKEYSKFFRNKYSGISSTQEGWTYEVLKNKQLVTPWGMIYHWPDCKVEGKYGYIKYTTSIYNYPVQGLATAEIIPIAVVYLWHRMKAAGMTSFLVNTIHDSVIAELNPEEIELYEKLAVQSLTTDVYKYLNNIYHIQFDVPLGVGIKIGDHWNEAEEKKIAIPPPF